MRFLMASVSALALFPFANLAFAEPTVPQVRPEVEQATKMLEAICRGNLRTATTDTPF
jgi:hypothetical protein